MKLGLIGYGNIARKHLEVFRALGCEVIASSNRSDEGNSLARTEGNIPNNYRDYRQMLDLHDVDGILVCASFQQIYPIARELMPYQIPILLEKPAGTNLQELEHLVQLQEQYGTPVQVAMNRRHYSVMHKAFADMGGRENLTAISIEWSENPKRVREQKGYPDEEIAQLIIGNSIHGIDTLFHFAGNIQTPCLLVKDFGGFFRWHMQAGGISENGVLCQFQSSWDNPVPWRIVLSSRGKRYVFAPLESCTMTSEQGKTTDILPDSFDIQYKSGFYLQARHFMQVASLGLTTHLHDLPSVLPGMRLAVAFTDAFKCQFLNEK